MVSPEWAARAEPRRIDSAPALFQIGNQTLQPRRFPHGIGESLIEKIGLSMKPKKWCSRL
jgi:hypothetical protein